MRLLLLGLLVAVTSTLAGCAHRPETVVHLTAPTTGGGGGGWVVRDHTGARLCALPCTVELETNQTVVVDRERSREGSGSNTFIVHQESLGAGTWSGAIHVRKEPSAGALALAAFSGALVTAGTDLASRPGNVEGNGRRGDRVATGLVLAGLGSAGLLASDALPGKSRPELWLDRMATTTPPRD
jgi:hypothetical protein